MSRKFIPQRKNANKHTQHGLRLLEKSLQRDGFIDAQTAAADGEIISGSARLEVSAEKFADVEPIIVESDGTRPVIVVRTDIPSADDPRARRLSVAANQIAHTDFDPDCDLLKEWGNEDKAIREMFADSEWQEITGEEKPTADAEPQIDKTAELLEKWQVKTGDLWQIGEHRLLCGDSTKREDVERVTGGEKASLFVTDPPYGVNYSELRTSQAEMRRTTVEYEDIEADKFTGKELQSFLESVFNVCKDNLKTNAAWYLWHAQLTQGFFAAAAAAADILIHRQIIWVKPSFIFGRGDYHWKHELCFYGWRKGNRPPFYGERNQDTVWSFGEGGGSSGGTHKDHPTQKPLTLYEIPLKNHTLVGEILLDPFLGSGTALVACQNLGRKGRGIEISPTYCAVTLERMATAFPSLEIRRIE